MRRAPSVPAAAAVAGVVASGALAHAGPMPVALHQRGRPDAAAEARDTRGSHDRTPGTPRDPFVRPALQPPDVTSEQRAIGEGLSAASIGDIVVRGVVQAHGERVALVQAPDGKHYQVRAGDRLRDGRVQAVGTDGLVIVLDHDAAARGASPVHTPLGSAAKTP